MILSCYTDVAWSKSRKEIYVAHVLKGGADLIHNSRVLQAEPFSSTYCEYFGMVYAMRYCLQIGELKVHFMNDNQTMMRQLSGRYQVHTQNLVTLYDEVMELQDRFVALHGVVKFSWIPGKENLADKYVRDLKREKSH
jgi:ribonuclease HI